MHTPCVELSASSVGQMSAPGSAVLLCMMSVSTVTTCSLLSSVVSSEEGTIATGSFSLFLFRIRFFPASTNKNCMRQQHYSHTLTSKLELKHQRHMPNVQIWVQYYSTYLWVHICVVAPLLATVV